MKITLNVKTPIFKARLKKITLKNNSKKEF